MPLPGGGADKAGNRYELAWTVSCLVDVYQGTAERIRIESPGADERGAEFVLCKKGVEEFHQCKLGPAGAGKWTINALAREGVVRQLLQFTRSENHEFRFVSTMGTERLMELAERARGATSFEEFVRDFLSAKSWKQAFDDLCSIILSPGELVEELGRSTVVSAKMPGEPQPREPEAQDAIEKELRERALREAVCIGLKRTTVATIDEHTLRSNVEGRLQLLFDRDPGTTFGALQDLALQSVHVELRGGDIVRFLESRGIHATDAAKSTIVLERVRQLSDSMWTRLSTITINGVFHTRSETPRVMEAIRADGHSVVLVSGAAGVGKSGVVLAAAKELESSGWMVLGFRADHSALDNVLLPGRVSEAFSLPCQPPSAILQAIAGGGRTLLVIDQFDSVSLTYGRRPALFDVLKEVIDDALMRGTNVLIGCRKFDIENDDRIRQLAARKECTKIEVGGFGEPEVRSIVTSLGADGNRLTPAQVKLFSIPLHLHILEKCGVRGQVAFDTEKDLFNKFWNEKRLAAQMRCPAVPWNDIMDRLLGPMTESATLHVPKIALSAHAPQAVDAMLSEQVIVEDDIGYRFFHEKFFDYAFARRFCEKGKSLKRMVLSGEQHLSIRNKVRQILLYRRDADPLQYSKDLEWILTDSGVRFHLKALVLDLLAQLSDPRADEWDVVRRLLINTDSVLLPADGMAAHAWRLLFLRSWFEQAHAHEDLLRWLRSDDKHTIDQTVDLLRWVDFPLPNDLVKTLEELAATSFEWTSRVVYLVTQARLASSRELLDLYLKMLRDGVLDRYYVERPGLRDFWGHMYTLAETEPGWACEGIAAYLRRGLEVADQRGITRSFDDHSGIFPWSQMDGSTMERCAESAPRAVLEHILPVVEETIIKYVDQTGALPWKDPVWVYRHIGEVFWLRGHLLRAVETSLARLATDNPQELRSVLGNLDPSYETNQYLIVRAYTAAGKALADEAVEFVCGKPERLETGYIDDPQHATRLLLEAVTPHCSTAGLTKLENVILNYFPDWEKKASFQPCRGSYRGWSQLKVIEGIPEAQRSSAIQRRIGELRRKFAGRLPTPPKPLRVHTVMSPVPENASAKLSDKQWLNAIKKYNTDDHGWHKERYDAPIGGALELSRQLQERAKSDPARFTRLAEKLPDDTHPYYFCAILDGVAESETELETLVSLIERCHRVPNRPCGKSVCRLIEKKAHLAWTPSSLEIVAWHATEDPDPERELWRTPAGDSGHMYYGGDILTAAINCTRGVAAETIGQLMFADATRISFFLPVVDRMVGDPSVAVRSRVAHAIGPIWNHDREIAIQLFLRLCETDDALLGTISVLHLLSDMLRTHFAVLRPLLKRMLRSSDAVVQKAGATMSYLAYLSADDASSAELCCHVRRICACLARLLTDDASSLVHRCYAGSPAHRKGLAEASAANVSKPQCQARCAASLRRLFDDPDHEVRAVAGSCFATFKDGELGGAEDLVKAYGESRALLDESFHILHALEETTAKMPDSSLRICESFVELLGGAVGDARFRAEADAPWNWALLPQWIPLNYENFLSNADPDSDGLTVWEEYRGFCCEDGSHFRLDTLTNSTKRQVVVIDEGGIFEDDSVRDFLPRLQGMMRCSLVVANNMITSQCEDDSNWVWDRIDVCQASYGTDGWVPNGLTDPGYVYEAPAPWPDLERSSDQVAIRLSQPVPSIPGEYGHCSYVRVMGADWGYGICGNAGVSVDLLLVEWDVRHWGHLADWGFRLHQVLQICKCRAVAHEFGHAINIDDHCIPLPPDTTCNQCVGDSDMCVVKNVMQCETQNPPEDSEYGWQVWINHWSDHVWGYKDDDKLCARQIRYRPPFR